MQTPLDTTAAWLWFPESAEYKHGELRLVLVEGSVSKSEARVEVLPGTVVENTKPIEVTANARRFLIHFQDVRLLHVLEEAAHKQIPDEQREASIVALHRSSALQRWVSESTLLEQLIPGELLHWSVATAGDFYHVVTRLHPTVSEIEA